LAEKLTTHLGTKVYCNRVPVTLKHGDHIIVTKCEGDGLQFYMLHFKLY